jgi:hypothetical protein
MQSFMSVWNRVRPAVALSALAAASLACGLGSNPTATPAPKPTEAAPTAEAAATDVPAAATESPVATEAAPTPEPSSGLDLACMTFSSGGVQCLDAAGLRTFSDADYDQATSYASDIALCGDRVAIAYYDEIVFFDGETFDSLKVKLSDEAYGVDDVACDPSGSRVAVSASGGFALLYSDGQWQEFNMKEWDRDDDPEYTDVTDVAVDAKGNLWVGLSSNLARWDGKDWTVFEGTGTDWEGLPVSQLVVSPADDLFASVDGKLLKITGDEMTVFDTATIFGAYAFQAVGDKLLIGHGFGAYVIDQEGHSLAEHPVGEQNELPFVATIYGLGLDGAGRLWMATTIGLVVADESGAYQAFRMSNTDLLDNAIDSLALVGSPALPPEVTHEPGQLTGIILQKGEPMVDAKVVACVIDYSSSEGACDGDPDFVSTQTDADGRFTFTDLPRGYYAIYVQVAADEWQYLDDPDGFFISDPLVDSGSSVDLGITQPNE